MIKITILSQLEIVGHLILIILKSIIILEVELSSILSLILLLQITTKYKGIKLVVSKIILIF